MEAGKTIRITFARGIDDMIIPIERPRSCEDVMWECLRHLKPWIYTSSDSAKLADYSALYLPAFGLRQVQPQVEGDNPIWMAYWQHFKPGPKTDEQWEYSFRVRHKPLHGFSEDVTDLDCILREYLFLQMLDDFLLDPTFPVDKIDETTFLLLHGIALCLKPTKLPFVNAHVVGKDLKTPKLNSVFSLPSYCTQFHVSKPISDKLRLHKILERHFHISKMIKTLKHFTGEKLSIHRLKFLFHHHLVTAVPDYCSESYQVKVSDQDSRFERTVSANLKLQCKDQNANGLYYGENHKCGISDIEEISLMKPEDNLQQTWKVRFSLQEGDPMFLLFKTEAEAESFLSMAETQIRLVIKWDFYRNHAALTPGDKLDMRLKSFGPLCDDTAEHYLSELSKRQDYSGQGFLVQRSARQHGIYDVLICTTAPVVGDGRPEVEGGSEISEAGDLSFQRHHILPQEDGSLRLTKALTNQDKMEGELFWSPTDLHRHLLQEFQLQVQPENYKKADILEEFRISTDKKDVNLQTEMNFYKDREKMTQFAFLPNDLMEEYLIPDKNIGVRKFRVSYREQTLMKIEVASRDESDEVAFREGVQKLMELERLHPNKFLKVHNIVVCRHFTVITELPPGHDLLTYICNKPQKPVQKVSLMLQVVRILQAMHESKVYHGNIRSRKFLVFPNDYRGARLKMEYPGITTHLDTLLLDDELNLERLAWLAPERRACLTHVDYATECYSVGTVLAEILHRSDSFAEIAGLKGDRQQLQLSLYLQNRFLPEPAELANDCELSRIWKTVWDSIIIPCWNSDPSLRPDPHSLVSSLNDILQMAQQIPDSEGKEVSRKVEYTDHGMRDNTPVVNEQQLVSLLQQNNKAFVKNLRLDHIGSRTLLGSGNYGIVYKVTMSNRIDNPLVAAGISEPCIAVKVFKLMDNVYEKDILQEINMAAQLNHLNIVKVLAGGKAPKFETQQGDTFSNTVMISEYLDSGSMEKFIDGKGHTCAPRIMLKICKDIVEGMIYLSGMNIVHRDLSPRNVLLQSLPTCGGEETLYVAKVSDFGLSRFMDENYRSYKNKSISTIPWPVWPPECLDLTRLQGRFSSEGDVWSFGVILWQAFNARVHSQVIDEMSVACKTELKRNPDACSIMFDKFKAGWRLPQTPLFPSRKDCSNVGQPRINRDTHTILYQHMTRCWEEIPNKRPRFVQLKVALDEIVF